MNTKDKQNTLEAVRKNYAAVAEKKNSTSPHSGCCNSVNSRADELSQRMGYSKEELASIPKNSNMGLGCGNPNVIADLKTGEIVLDLGSGGGIDCFLAAKAVGHNGYVIGVDMTPEMISKARRNAEKFTERNIEFRLGEIEHLPVADNSIDVIISNCVINLSTDKTQTFKEAYRVLKPGGRLAISDIVSLVELPNTIKQDLKKYTACISGALSVQKLRHILERCGFAHITISPKGESKEFIKEWTDEMDVTKFVVSATIEATKL